MWVMITTLLVALRGSESGRLMLPCPVSRVMADAGTPRSPVWQVHDGLEPFAAKRDVVGVIESGLAVGVERSIGRCPSVEREGGMAVGAADARGQILYGGPRDSRSPPPGVFEEVAMENTGPVQVGTGPGSVGQVNDGNPSSSGIQLASLLVVRCCSSLFVALGLRVCLTRKVRDLAQDRWQVGPASYLLNGKLIQPPQVPGELLIFFLWALH